MSLDDYTVCRLGRADLALFKEIRLRALATDPQVFGSNHARESTFDDAEWTRRSCEPNVGVWGVFHHDRIVGMTGTYIAPDDLSTCQLWGSWLAAAHRGLGLSSMMYTPRIAWSRRKGVMRIVVSHRASNLASKSANQRHGFVYTHSEPHTWPDGTTEDQMHYTLKL